MNANPEAGTFFPRVTLPGLSDAESGGVSFVRTLMGAAAAHEKHLQRERVGMVAAMMRTGYRPYLGTAKRKPKRATKNVRHMRRIAARVSAL